MPKQKSPSTQAETIHQKARTFGARKGKIDKVKLAKITRKKISWYSTPVLSKLGLPPKPNPGSTCQQCGKAKLAFELDHMGPWRVYVAALAGPHVDKKGMIPMNMLRALYNDPDNLWWICRDCNSEKSDFVSDRGGFPTKAAGATRGSKVDVSIFNH